MFIMQLFFHQTTRYCPFLSLRIIHFPASPLLPSMIIITLFPWLIARAIIFFFAQKGGDYLREVIISNIAHWKSFVLFVIKLKNNHIGLTEHGLFSTLINFYSLNHHWSVSHESHCTSTWQGGNKRKRRWWEEQRGGNYSREAII